MHTDPGAQEPQGPGARHRAVGTWRQTLQFPNASIRTIFSFTNDGVAHAVNEVEADSGLGVWEAAGGGRFRVTMFFFPHAPTGSLIGINRIRATLTLTDDDHFSGTHTIDQFDTTEQTIRNTLHVTAQGVRMNVIPQ